MNQFVQRILAELKTNHSVNSEPLVRLLVESVDKSIALGENSDSVYSNLKRGILTINESIKNPTLDLMLSHFNKNEDTVDSRVEKIAKSLNLTSKLEKIKESDAYVLPLVQTLVEGFEKELAAGSPDFAVCGRFVDSLEAYKYDDRIKQVIESTKEQIAKNYDTFLMLEAIFQMNSINSPIYAGVVSDLKNMLVTESYSADILKIKYGTSVPVVTNLISSLRLVESKKNGSFTIGEGSMDTRVNNLIAPSAKIKDGMVIYTDNRFLAIRESKSLTDNDSKIHYDGRLKITDLNPSWVRENLSDFYSLCESYAYLGFAKTGDGMGVQSTSIKNTKIGFLVNEQHNLDFVINDVTVGEPTSINVSEALSLESNQTKSHLVSIINNTANIYNLEFVKEISNDRTLAEAIVINIDNNYYVCEKKNAVDRDWTKCDEYALYEFFKSKFNYDISPIFKTQIDETVEKINQVENAKKKIVEDIQRLEESVVKLDGAIANPNLTQTESARLVSVRESVEKAIHEMKQNYIKLDLLKKKQHG